MPQIKEMKSLLTDNIKQNGGLKNAWKQAKILKQQRVLVCCDPDITEEITLLLKETGLYLDEMKPTAISGVRTMDLPAVSMTWRKTPIDPLCTKYEGEWERRENHRLAIMINKEYKQKIETLLYREGWKLNNEISYPFVGGVQTWTKERV